MHHIDQVNERIVFTVEEKRDGRLPFLDVVVGRMEAVSLRTSVFRKDTHTNRTLNFWSEHADSAKAAVLHALDHR